MLQNVAKYGKKGCCKTQDLKGDHATHGKTWERREACHLPVPSHRLLVSLVDGDHIEEAHFGFGQTVHVGRQQETHPGAQKARQHWPEKEVDFTLPRIQPRKKQPRVQKGLSEVSFKQTRHADVNMNFDILRFYVNMSTWHR
jgi:hypothetical protein